MIKKTSQNKNINQKKKINQSQARIYKNKLKNKKQKSYKWSSKNEKKVNYNDDGYEEKLENTSRSLEEVGKINNYKRNDKNLTQNLNKYENDLLSDGFGLSCVENLFNKIKLALCFFLYFFLNNFTKNSQTEIKETPKEKTKKKEKLKNDENILYDNFCSNYFLNIKNKISNASETEKSDQGSFVFENIKPQSEELTNFAKDFINKAFISNEKHFNVNNKKMLNTKIISDRMIKKKEKKKKEDKEEFVKKFIPSKIKSRDLNKIKYKNIKEIVKEEEEVEGEEKNNNLKKKPKVNLTPSVKTFKNGSKKLKKKSDDQDNNNLKFKMTPPFENSSQSSLIRPKMTYYGEFEDEGMVEKVGKVFNHFDVSPKFINSFDNQLINILTNNFEEPNKKKLEKEKGDNENEGFAGKVENNKKIDFMFEKKKFTKEKIVIFDCVINKKNITNEEGKNLKNEKKLQNEISASEKKKINPINEEIFEINLEKCNKNDEIEEKNENKTKIIEKQNKDKTEENKKIYKNDENLKNQELIKSLREELRENKFLKKSLEMEVFSKSPTMKKK